jgi:pimeloyl-ACP methyl ester carboxylesterase
MLDRYDATALDAPAAGARLRLAVSEGGAWDVLVRHGEMEVRAAEQRRTPDALLTADRATWTAVADDPRAGLAAFRDGRLIIRRNLHLGIGLLAATAPARNAAALKLEHIDTRRGRVALMTAGAGDPVLLIHGLGATAGSFFAVHRRAGAVVPRHRVGPSRVRRFLQAAHGAVRSAVLRPRRDRGAGLRSRSTARTSSATVSGGGVALEVGLRHPERVRRIALLAPSLAWRRARPWAPLVRMLRPELGALQLAPRWAIEGVVHRTVPSAENHWVRAGVDEFLRTYLTPRGRVAFYAAARQIYLEEPHGATGFWTRLARLQTTRAVHLGQARLARPDRFRRARAHRGADIAAPRARLRPRARSSSSRSKPTP